MNKLIRKIIMYFSIACNFNAYAFDYVNVTNMSLLSWQMVGDRVYLRNLNQFNGGFAGCCYSIWFDISSPSGRAMWNAAQIKIATSKQLYLGLTNPAGGQIEHIGNW